MRLVGLVAACFTSCFLLMSGCSQAPPTMTAEQLQATLQGRWNITRSVYDGKDVTKNGTAGSGLDFKSNTVKLVGSVIEHPLGCTYDATIYPNRITMQPEWGEPFLQGIVEVNGAKMRLCYRMHAKKELGFPQDFESSAGSGIMFIEAHRAGH